MSEIAHLAATIFKRAGKAPRFVVAIAGPPGAGKSTLSASLHDLLPEGSSEVVPMDGFHYDDIVLNQRGLRPRKGAPETFDFAGFETLLKRIRSGEPDIAIPVFDRSMELSRAAAAIVGAGTKFILVEGNYLLLDEEPWSSWRRCSISPSSSTCRATSSNAACWCAGTGMAAPMRTPAPGSRPTTCPTSTACWRGGGPPILSSAIMPDFSIVGREP